MATKILQFYADCDGFQAASYLFDKMPNPNIFAWTAIIALFSRTKNPNHCLLLYFKMRSYGISPDPYVFPLVIRASSIFSFSISLHQHAVILGHGFHLHVCNSLIHMYSKFSDFEHAEKVFERMPIRDILSWNTMISGYVAGGLSDRAIHLFEFMAVGGISPDKVTLNISIDAYCRVGLCHEGARVLRSMEDPDLISWTTLISGYSRAGEHDKSLGVFREMMSTTGKWFWSPVALDPESISSVLVSCRHLGSLRNGQAVHARGLKMLSGFYDSVGAALMAMYAVCGTIAASRRVFGLMGRRDAPSWNAMVFGFVQDGSDSLAFECLEKMIAAGVGPDDITLSTLLPTCGLGRGKEIHGYARRWGFVDSVSVSNALVHMYAGGGSIEAAYHFFLGMDGRDVVSWNTMIAGFGKHGLGVAAVGVFRGMCVSGFRPNGATFTSVLSACSHSGLVDEGIRLFAGLRREYGSVLRTEHFACVVDMLARAGRVDEAVEFVRAMPMTHDSGSVWGALLVASRAHGDVAVARAAAESLFRAEPGHAGNYVTLSHVYARVGRWDDALDVRRQIEHRSLMKPFGRSSVGHGSTLIGSN